MLLSLNSHICNAQCILMIMDSFKAAMASEENKAAGKDLMSFAGPLVSMSIGSVEDISL